MAIINADDFGLSPSANRAIIEAFKSGLISDTTIMANGEDFEDAVKLVADYGYEEKIGIHFNLTEGKPLTEDIRHCRSFCENGVFHHKNNRFKPLNRFEKQAIYEELTAQAKRVRDAGLVISHADSHHHIHTAFFISPIVLRVCKETGINKIRLHRNIGHIPAYKKAVKNLYNKSLRKKGFITTDYFGSLTDLGEHTMPDNLEIMVHPDYDKDGVLIDRREFTDNMPAGVPLLNVAEKYGISLKCYGELK